MPGEDGEQVDVFVGERVALLLTADQNCAGEMPGHVDRHADKRAKLQALHQFGFAPAVQVARDQRRANLDDVRQRVVQAEICIQVHAEIGDGCLSSDLQDPALSEQGDDAHVHGHFEDGGARSAVEQRVFGAGFGGGAGDAVQGQQAAGAQLGLIDQVSQFLLFAGQGTRDSVEIAVGLLQIVEALAQFSGAAFGGLIQVSIFNGQRGLIGKNFQSLHGGQVGGEAAARIVNRHHAHGLAAGTDERHEQEIVLVPFVGTGGRCSAMDDRGIQLHQLLRGAAVRHVVRLADVKLRLNSRGNIFEVRRCMLESFEIGDG